MLIEAGYRCAVPTCRTILTLELHHIDPVRVDGQNTPDNLIALCPNCHTMLEKGIIAREAINVYKTMLVALNQAFDKESISNLLFLKKISEKPSNHSLVISGDGVLRFSHLIASELAEYEAFGSPPRWDYLMHLTKKGNRIIDAWFSGSMKQVKQALNNFSQEY
jgi:hypothetical protein